MAPSTWAELNERANTDKAVDYNFKNTYEANTVLDHKKFGIGFIIKVEGQKMEVVFQDQIRQLIHGR